MKNSLFKGLLAFFLMLGTSMIYAQDVSGVVSDSSGSLPGATVTVKGTKQAVQTDFDGKYTVKNVGFNAVLVFSYIGLKTQEIAVAGKSNINVTLKEDSAELKEVVVIGFGKQTKRKVTDNIASINADQINQIPVSNFQGALTGKAAGVQITQINGKVESGVKMRIRGVSSISSSQEPLYVIDGMPLINDDESNSGAPINPLISINPDDIASIQILKDASSAAIYGARGTNGVVLITTKQGKAGKTKISLNTSSGWSEATHKLKWLNAAQYVELFKETATNYYGNDTRFTKVGGRFDRMSNGKDWRTGQVDTNWQDLALVKGAVQDHTFSISGGDDKTTFYVSGGYNNTIGIVRGNNMDRYSFRGNFDHKVSDKFRVGLNTNLSKTQITRIGSDSSFSTPLQAIAQSPLSPAYLDNGIPNNDGTTYYNFLMQEYNGSWKVNLFKTLMNTYAEYKIIPSLKFRSELGYDNNNQTEEYFSGSLTLTGASTNGYADVNVVQSDKYNLNNYFTFNKNFNDKYDLEVVGGMSFEESSRKRQFVSGIGFPTDALQTLDNAAEINGGKSSRTKYNFLSYFGRSTLSINNKYLFKASLRYDGSSRFGAANRYGVFPAGSVGWVISEEDFLKGNSVVNYLKLRSSIGLTGNAGIDNFASLGLTKGAAYDKNAAIVPEQLTNRDLKWEKTTQVDFGLDFGFLNNRISGEIDYYEKNTNDLLLNEPLPGTSGWSTLTKNVGSMKNKGFEFVLNTTNIKNENLTWKTSFNLSTLKNEVTKLPGGDIVDESNIVKEGNAISSFYLVEYAGVDPANGDALFYKNTLKSDGTLDKTKTNDYRQAQRIVTGNPFPKLMGGITNTVNYQNFDLSFTFQGEWGASLYNDAGRFQSSNATNLDNQTVDQLTRWQKPGDITMVPQARYDTNGNQASTRYLEKSDFIRLRNLSFGYTLPKEMAKRISLDRVRLYMTGLNLLTFTKYSGYDPESTYDNNGSSNIRKGITYYSAPPARTIMIGLNIDL